MFNYSIILLLCQDIYICLIINVLFNDALKASWVELIRVKGSDRNWLRVPI